MSQGANQVTLLKQIKKGMVQFPIAFSLFIFSREYIITSILHDK